MKIIYNKLIPFKGYAAVNLFGVLFVRKGVTVNQRMLNHEAIHTRQMKEMAYIFFYLWYIIEWIVRLFQYRFKSHSAYRAISFEQEAYDNDFYSLYNEKRKPFEFLTYLKIKP